MFALCTGEMQVPPQESRKRIIKEYHTSLVGGHKGITKTFKLIRSRFVWPEMRADIMSFIRTCLSCQRNNVGPLSSFSTLASSRSTMPSSFLYRGPCLEIPFTPAPVLCRKRLRQHPRRLDDTNVLIVVPQCE